jgi:hypothetical protein
MALRSAFWLAMPVQAGLFGKTAARPVFANVALRPCTMRPEMTRAFAAVALQRSLFTEQKRPADTCAKLSAPLQSCASTRVPGVLGGVRAMSSWRLRPYATAGATAVTPMGTLSAGFSKVGLSLLVLPWKALPMALVLAPACWILPAFYRLIFTNSMRATTASAFSSLLALTVSFAPVPVFENLFSDFAFYSVALVTSFFTYMFFPELFLNDFMAMHFFVLFMIPLIPLAFTYMPMMHARSYFTL